MTSCIATIINDEQEYLDEVKFICNSVECWSKDLEKSLEKLIAKLNRLI